jgi:hypothetical protein
VWYITDDFTFQTKFIKCKRWKKITLVRVNRLSRFIEIDPFPGICSWKSLSPQYLMKVKIGFAMNSADFVLIN